MKRLFFVLMLIGITGCGSIPRPDYFNNKLNNMIKINNQIGAMLKYNTNRLNSPYRIGSIPTTQFQWQQWNMINSKLNKHLGG
jgi:hypothetical protein